ncbi:MAG: 30S ribosomal protein S16 [bacterium]
MLAIKLSRFGKKKQPTFRLIVLEKSKDPWGDYLENLGHYDPRTKKATFNAERINYWMSKGAKPTDSVHNLLVTSGVLKDKKRAITKISKKRKAKLEKETGEKAAADKAKQEKAEAAKAAAEQAKQEKLAAEKAAEEAAKEVKPEAPAASPEPAEGQVAAETPATENPPAAS